MRLYWALFWRTSVLCLVGRYLARAWQRNPYRKDVTP